MEVGIGGEVVGGRCCGRVVCQLTTGRTAAIVSSCGAAEATGAHHQLPTMTCFAQSLHACRLRLIVIALELNTSRGILEVPHNREG